jgi:uncharacterized protein (TIGR02231 family)
MAKKLSFFGAWIIGIFLFVCLCASGVWAEPTEVILYPDSAKITEVKKVSLASDGIYLKAVLYLRFQADPDSLTASLPQGSLLKIVDQTWREISRQDEEKVKSLLKQIQTLKDERSGLQAWVQSLDTQIEFWHSQSKSKTKTITDAVNMASAIGKNIRKVYGDKINQETEINKLSRRIAELEDQLNKMVGQKENMWEVTVLISGRQTDETTLTYSYFMSECGWQPFYRLEARPQQKNILFTWEAELWQSSGQDWKNVRLSLATLRPPSSITPADLPPWIIKPKERRSIISRKEKALYKAEAMPDVSAEMGLGGYVEETPTPIKQSTFVLWQLGKKTILAGLRQKVKVQEEIWPSEFTYLARPSINTEVFVRAFVKFQDAKEIPQGSAIFMIDGAILGKREFSLTGQDSTLFFGVDPLVTTRSTLLSKKSGEKTFLKDKQTYSWNWQIDILNAKNFPIKLRLEEPPPQSRDERIKLTVKSVPEPVEQNPETMIWNLDLQAGQKQSLLTTVTLEAPKDMDLDLGWRY